MIKDIDNIKSQKKETGTGKDKEKGVYSRKQAVIVKAKNADDSQKFYDNEIGGEDFYLSPENAARYLDVSRKFIYELIQSKKIESVRLGRKLKRIKKRTLDEWLTLQAMKFER